MLEAWLAGMYSSVSWETRNDTLQVMSHEILRMHDCLVWNYIDGTQDVEARRKSIVSDMSQMTLMLKIMGLHEAPSIIGHGLGTDDKFPDQETLQSTVEINNIPS